MEVGFVSSHFSTVNTILLSYTHASFSSPPLICPPPVLMASHFCHFQTALKRAHREPNHDLSGGVCAQRLSGTVQMAALSEVICL